MIQRDIVAIAELDHPFPKLRLHVLNRASDMGTLAEYLAPRADRLHGALRSVRILRREEAVKMLYIGKRFRCPNQLWHLGKSASSPISSFASRASAFSAVTCR